MDFSNHRNLPVSEQSKARPDLCLLAGQDGGQLDSLVSGGVYALVPQSPPARYPLWAGLLRDATRDGRVCHVLLRTPAPDFLARLAKEGWAEVMEAWRDERLRVYPMVEDFATQLFRLDIEGLTAEFSYWGFRQDELVMVDAADELLSLHDLALATSQLAKLRTWTQSQNLPLLLNFTFGASVDGSNSLTRLMDNLSGIARIHSDHTGPVLTLEYWQGSLGTAAERILLLQQNRMGYTLRPEPSAVVPVHAGGLQVPGSLPGSVEVPTPAVVPPVSIAQDKVWARELQMLTGQDWQACDEIDEMLDRVGEQKSPLLVLRFGADSTLSDLAADVHRTRTALGVAARLVVAEHRVSLRYANEMMLLRLGANAIIRQDVPLRRWPAALDALKGQVLRAMPDVDVMTAMSNAASPHGRGYVAVPDFLTQLHEAKERSKVLDVPFALAVIKPKPYCIGKAIAAATFRRNGDFITTDGHVIVVFFNACSLTRGQQVLEGTFEGSFDRFGIAVDWMSSDRDVDGLISKLADGHATDPFNLEMYEEGARVAEALFNAPPLINTTINSEIAADAVNGESSNLLVGEAPTSGRQDESKAISPKTRAKKKAKLADQLEAQTPEDVVFAPGVETVDFRNINDKALGEEPRVDEEEWVVEAPEAYQPPLRHRPSAASVRTGTPVLKRLVKPAGSGTVGKKF